MDKLQESTQPLLESHQDEHVPHRGSLEDAYRSSFESDLDVSEFLSHDSIPLQDLNRDPERDEKIRPVAAYDTYTQLAHLRRNLTRRTKCLIVTLLVCIIFWSILTVGGFYVYKLSPKYGQSPPWYPTPLGGSIGSSWEKSYVKAAALVERMTLTEKVNVTTGTGWMMGLAVGQTGAANHVGFPSLALQDGPLGIRFSDHSTAFPAGITTGATWNKELMYERGKAHGLEARLKGINVLLGPCVGPLGRMPAGGRNWEGFGSDPYLQGIAAAQTVKGIQEQGVMATIKHLVGNEQEHFRQAREWILKDAISSNIDDRALHELYLWPFQDSVKAGVASVMCSYNMLNNSYACGNSKLLNGILKDELGFQGFVQSDWLAQRGGVSTALAGLDMTMPGDGIGWQDGKSLWGASLTTAILNGSIPMSRLNDMVTRVVAAYYQLGQDDKTKFDGKGPNFSSWTKDEKGYVNAGSPDDKDLQVVNTFIDVQGNGTNAHSIIARRVAAEGTVLLKNEDNLLPLSRDGWHDGKKHELVYRVGLFGEDAGEGKGINECPDQSCNHGTLGSGWGSGAVDFPYIITPIAALKKVFNPDKVYVTEFPTNKPPMTRAPEILLDQDICIVFVNADAGEGYLKFDGILGDRNDLFLQNNGDILVEQVADGCGGGKGQTIVVIHSVGPVIVDKWINTAGVKAVIFANLPGQESGNALADILFGDVNPSGKLPFTLGKSLKDYGEGGQVLYLPNGLVPQQNFSEGLYIDYRHFDKYNIDPSFEFGFGLSYTNFSFSRLAANPLLEKSSLPKPRPTGVSPPKYNDTLPDPSTALFPSGFRKLKNFIYPYIEKVTDIKSGKYQYPDGYDIEQPLSQAGGGEGGNPSLYDVHVSVMVDVTNTGPVAGQHVAQLYLSYPGSPSLDVNGISTPNGESEIDFPVKVLRGFEKMMLERGETKSVKFELTRRDLSYWDIEEQNWVMPVDGKFKIRVGSSSRDLKMYVEY